MSRFNLPIPLYYQGGVLSESVVSIFFSALFQPRKMFEQMPEASGFRNNAKLLVVYLSVPTLMMTLTFGTAVPQFAPNFITGLLMVLLIYPVSISIGLASSYLWAWYLSRAIRVFTGREVSVEVVFQICAYSGAPFAIAWGPYLGPVMALWNFFLNWRGLVSHARVGRLAALLIMMAGISWLFVLMIVLFALLVVVLPENMEMLGSVIQAYMHARGWL